MTQFVPFNTRFSISADAPAKVAKPAKVEEGGAPLSQLSQVSRQAIPETENAPPDRLSPTAERIAASVAAGAERESDPDGWLVLVLPDGRRHVVAPNVVSDLHSAGLMPKLPPKTPRSAYASTARPPSWSDTSDTPSAGDFCWACRSGRWWTAEPEAQGWACAVCHPPLVQTVRTVQTKR
jgi:hypothetical protein